jgi:prepilin-type N-terminal cleavage/methylation domain-containing protein
MHKQRGFTLVELLVVIAIIALLMSILMPALAKAKKLAIVVLDQSNLRQWAICFSAYTNNNEGYFMSGLNPFEWMDEVSIYCGDEKAAYCPLAKAESLTTGKRRCRHILLPAAMG